MTAAEDNGVTSIIFMVAARFEPSASHRRRIDCVSIMQTLVEAQMVLGNPTAVSHVAASPKSAIRFTYWCRCPKWTEALNDK